MQSPKNFVIFVLAVMLTGSVFECEPDSPSGPGDGDSLVDTSLVGFEHLGYTPYTEDGVVETGLELRFVFGFTSTTNRILRVNRFLLTSGAGLLLDREVESPRAVSSGSTLSGKETWIPVDAPTPAGEYTFSALYETGRLYINAIGDTVWTRLSRGSLDTIFTIQP